MAVTVQRALELMQPRICLTGGKGAGPQSVGRLLPKLCQAEQRARGPVTLLNGQIEARGGLARPLQMMGQCITNKGGRRLQLELRQQSHSIGADRFHAQIEGHGNFSDRFPATDHR